MSSQIIEYRNTITRKTSEKKISTALFLLIKTSNKHATKLQPSGQIKHKNISYFHRAGGELPLGAGGSVNPLICAKTQKHRNENECSGEAAALCW